MKLAGWLAAILALGLVVWIFVRRANDASREEPTSVARVDTRPRDPTSHERLLATANARVTGVVLVGENLPLAELDIQCIPSRETGKPARFVTSPRPLDEAGRGEYTLAGLPDGRATILVVPRNGPVVLRLEVELHADETHSLEPFDLRRLVHALHVVVRDELGEGINQSRLLVRGRDALDDWRAVNTDDGHATVRARSEQMDFVIGASGYRTRTVQGASEDFEIRLARGISVELVLDADSLATLGPDGTLAVALERGELSGDQSSFARRELAKPDANGRATTRLSEPGRFRVEVDVTVRRGKELARFAAPCEPATIDVRDLEEPQTLAVALSAADRAALRAFLAP
ncbi:MAG: hypothetical protein K8S98_07395 [Planctomycetes bacterium]|nr:hypothetical protein [Planctomycetota bacterium]